MCVARTHRAGVSAHVEWNAVGSSGLRCLPLVNRPGFPGGIESIGPTQVEAAMHLGVTQPRISDLMRGKIDAFSLDRLVRLAHAAGLRGTMEVQPVV